MTISRKRGHAEIQDEAVPSRYFFSRLTEYETVQKILENIKFFYSQAKDKSPWMKTGCEKIEEKLDQGSRWLSRLMETRLFKKLSPTFVSALDMFWCRQLDRLESLLYRKHSASASSVSSSASSSRDPTSPLAILEDAAEARATAEAAVKAVSELDPSNVPPAHALTQWLDYFVSSISHLLSFSSSQANDEQASFKKRKTVQRVPSSTSPTSPTQKRRRKSGCRRISSGSLPSALSSSSSFEELPSSEDSLLDETSVSTPFSSNMKVASLPYSSSSHHSFPLEEPSNSNSKHMRRSSFSFTAPVGSTQHFTPIPPSTKFTDVARFGATPSGAKTVNQYTLLHTIGAGSFGKVKVCHDQNNQMFAVKIFNKARLMKQNVAGTVFQRRVAFDYVLREIEILELVKHHPNVISLIEVINDPESPKLYTILEYAPRGSLTDNLESCRDPDFLRKCIWDIVQGLQHIHFCHVIHRDIKPDNLLVAETGVKISDFGVAVIIDSDEDPALRRTVGTPAFLPPELCADAPHLIGSALDLWSLGVTLYYCTFEKLPFTTKSKNQLGLFQSIAKKPVTFPYQINPDLQDLIYKLLIKDPKKRITLKQIIKHPWFQQMHV